MTIGKRKAFFEASKYTSFFCFTGSSTTEKKSTFQCRLDGGSVDPCSKNGYTGLGAGPHQLEARATDPHGNVDATAATWNWTVLL